MKWLRRILGLMILALIGSGMGHAVARWVQPAPPVTLSSDHSLKFFPARRPSEYLVQPEPGVLRVRASASILGCQAYDQQIWWRIEIRKCLPENVREVVWTQDYGHDRRHPLRGQRIGIAFDDSFCVEPGFYQVFLSVREAIDMVHGPDDVDPTPAVIGRSFLTEVR
jgi:hypothetical protein